jgi:hypothetical protein
MLDMFRWQSWSVRQDFGAWLLFNSTFTSQSQNKRRLRRLFHPFVRHGIMLDLPWWWSWPLRQASSAWLLLQRRRCGLRLSCIVDYARRKSIEIIDYPDFILPWIKCQNCKQWYEDKLMIDLLNECRQLVDEQYPGINWRHLPVQKQFLGARDLGQ